MSANSTNVPPASTNTGLVNFGQNSNQTDPFGAAPAANLQKTGKIVWLRMEERKKATIIYWNAFLLVKQSITDPMK